MRKTSEVCRKVLKVQFEQHEYELVLMAISIVANNANEAGARELAHTLANKLMNLQRMNEAAEIKQVYAARDWKTKAELRDREF